MPHVQPGDEAWRTARGVAAVIIGRAGSKGLPRKNERTIAAHPVITFSIDHARAARSVTDILISTDSQVIRAQAVEHHPTVRMVDRPASLASDTATIDSAVRHAVETIYPQPATRPDITVILYANVPIRPDGLIDRAVQLLVESGADSVQSYTTVGKYHPYWEMIVDHEQRVRPYVQNTVYRRQDLPPLFIPDGGVIAVTSASLFRIIEGQPHAFLGKDRRAVINQPGEVIDIDTEIDLAVAEAMILNREKGGSRHAPR